MYKTEPSENSVLLRLGGLILFCIVIHAVIAIGLFEILGESTVSAIVVAVLIIISFFIMFLTGWYALFAYWDRHLWEKENRHV